MARTKGLNLLLKNVLSLRAYQKMDENDGSQSNPQARHKRDLFI